MFTKILIANRGEIAVRIIRACKEMGIKTVAVYSECDKESLHVKLSDESICIGKSQAKDSYLNVTSIISAAVVTNAQAIHPGYGFLSENAKFAKLCEDCNIKFIGPDFDTIRKMGDKDEARKTMKLAGVPIISGSDVIEDFEEAKKTALNIGFPLLIKARSGGGGKGIRIVYSMDDLEHSFNSARIEAETSFKDNAVYMEKLLEPVKHIEMQIIADNYGNVVCLGERDCSIQRKNQKLIEESPSISVDKETRDKMTEFCKKAVKAANYKNVGTIEFLLDEYKNFYFMEMNTRLQVEHPVTEMVTGVDLVKWQIRIAAGMKLGFTQDDIKIQGHSIECRINAENPYNNFMPNSGTINFVHVPGGFGVRFDTYVYSGYTVPPFYDSTIGKLIVKDNTRESAIRKIKVALSELLIDGIVTNIDYQMSILENDKFKSGDFDTKFIDNQDII